MSETYRSEFNGGSPIESQEGLEAGLRREQRSDLTQLSRSIVLDGDSPPAAFNPEDALAADKYDALGRQLYARFVAQLPIDKRHYAQDSTRFGFLVISRLLQFAPPAYVAYCQKTETTPDILNLADILRDSGETPQFFAAMDSDKNHAYESIFGLYGGKPGFDHPPFVIQQDVLTSAVRYIPSPLYLASLQKPTPSPQTKIPRYARCPGTAIIRLGWLAGIAHCEQDPGLFAADLCI